MIGLGVAFLILLALASTGGTAKAAPDGAAPPAPDLPPIVPGPPDASKPQATTTGRSGTKWITQAVNVNPSTGYVYVDVFLPDGQMGSHPTFRVLRYSQPPGSGAEQRRTFMGSAPGVDPQVLALAMSDFNLKGAVKGPIDMAQMSADLQKEVADALAALTVGPDGKIVGPITAAGIQFASGVAGDLDRAGFGAAATALRVYIKAAQGLLPPVPPSKQIPLPPSIPPDLQQQINQALQLERDPEKLTKLLNALKAYVPQSPEIQNAIGLLQALILQIQAQKSAADAVKKIDKVVTPPPAPVPKPAPYPPAVSPAPAPAPAPMAHTYQTQHGDTGSSIALKFTGNANRWPELRDANPGTASKQYGMAFNAGVAVLNLPASWPSVPHGAAPAPMPTPVPSGSHTYQTQHGDTGSSIALKFTGNANRWPELRDANPGTASKQYGMAFNAGTAVLNLPASWPSVPGGAAVPPPVMAPPSLPDAPLVVPPVPMPGPLPQPKTPVEMAADAMVRNLKAVQGRYGMPGAHGHEDKSLVTQFQSAAGLGADGMAGAGTMVAAAVHGQSDLPLVMYWPKVSSAQNVLKYRADLNDIASRAQAAGDITGATQLMASAAREHGEGGISTGQLVP